MSSLPDLAIKYKADKSEVGHNYIQMYDYWLLNRPVNTLLEIGFGSGASAQMWREYYPNANIYIIELFGDEFKETWNSPDTSIAGVNIIAGDASSAGTWNKVPDDIDILIDDGSHYPLTQIATFNLAFSKVKSKGLYIIEDIYCNFDPDYTHHDILFPWLNRLMIQQQNSNSQYLSRDFYINRKYMSYPASDIYAYHIYKNAIIFEKG